MQAISGLWKFIVSIQRSHRGTMTMFQSPALYQPPAVMQHNDLNLNGLDMKNILILFNTILIFSCCNNSKKNINDIKDYELFGDIKNIKETNYKAVEKFGEVLKEERKTIKIICFNSIGYLSEENWYHPDSTLFYKTTCMHDEKGNKIEEKHYNQSDSLIFKIIYKYNDNGKLIERIFFGTFEKYGNNTIFFKYDNKGLLVEEDWCAFDGTLNQKNKFNYNSKGNLIEVNEYESEGALIQKKEFKYNNKGNLIKEEWYKSDGTINYNMELKYDKNGNKIAVILYNMDSSIGVVYNYKYDNKGNMIEESTSSPDGIFNNHITFNNYDKKGNWTRKIEYENGIPKHIIEREIQYYN